MTELDYNHIQFKTRKYNYIDYNYTKIIQDFYRKQIKINGKMINMSLLAVET